MKHFKLGTTQVCAMGKFRLCPPVIVVSINIATHLEIPYGIGVCCYQVLKILINSLWLCALTIYSKHYHFLVLMPISHTQLLIDPFIAQCITAHDCYSIAKRQSKPLDVNSE